MSWRTALACPAELLPAPTPRGVRPRDHLRPATNSGVGVAAGSQPSPFWIKKTGAGRRSAFSAADGCHPVAQGREVARSWSNGDAGDTGSGVQVDRDRRGQPTTLRAVRQRRGQELKSASRCLSATVSFCDDDACRDRIPAGVSGRHWSDGPDDMVRELDQIRLRLCRQARCSLVCNGRVRVGSRRCLPVFVG